MSIANYSAALTTLRSLIATGDLVGARRQLLIARTHAAETPDGNFDGAAYKLRTQELDKIKAELDTEIAADRAATGDRIIHTRTNFPTRCPGGR